MASCSGGEGIVGGVGRVMVVVGSAKRRGWWREECLELLSRLVVSDWGGGTGHCV